METNLFDSSEDYELMIFLGENKGKITFDTSLYGAYAIVKVEDKTFDDLYWCLDLVSLYSIYYLRKKITDDKAYLIRLQEDKMGMIALIERIKRFLKNHKDCEKYDFRGFIAQFDAAIKVIKTQTDIALLESQVETNRISRITNIYIAIFTFIAAEYYCYEFLRNYISDLNTNKPKIINGFIYSLLGLGIIGYLRLNPTLKKRRTPNT